MTNLKIIQNKISFIEAQLKLLKMYNKYSLAVILDDPTLRGAVERYLYLAVQGSIDLADATIAFKKLRKPTTYSESFYILLEEKIIPRDLQESLVNMTGFSNVVAHAYQNIDYNIMYDVLHNKLDDIKKFLKLIRSKLKIY
ncbi:DUF86 domain-containing protein [Candidatus Peregrinibacteria bacterium]|nr:DUF86 domain-containing protein [Candidatus Peregrinibacteria bacterium]